MSTITHPDMGVFREQVKSQTNQPLDYSAIESQVFMLFKETQHFAILKSEVIDAVCELAGLFDHESLQAETIKTRLTEILNRATITIDQSPQDFGNQKVNVIQLTCLRFKQLAAIARQLKCSTAANATEVDIKSYLGHLKDCVKNIAANYLVCGPGVVQKVEDEFSVLRLKLFPPAIDQAITEAKNYLFRQVIIEFCNEVYGFNNTPQQGNPILIGNQIHYVAAWQDRLIDLMPEFADLPKSNDTHAPILSRGASQERLTNTLKMQVLRKASDANACRFLAESVFQEIRSHLGEKIENISDNFSEFNEVLKQIQTRFPGLSADHFLQTDDLFNYRLRKDTDHATLFLLKALPAARFSPITFWKGDGLQFKMFSELAWLESTGSTPSETEIDFDLTPDSFFRNLDASRSSPGERIAQLLPVISLCLYRKNPADRVPFLFQVLQSGFGVNLIEHVRLHLDDLKSPSDASNVIVACSQLIADLSLPPHLNYVGVRDLLQWHDRTDALNKYFGNPDLVIDKLALHFLSNSSLKELFSFARDMKNPELIYRLITASSTWQPKARAAWRLLGGDPWKREVISLKREARRTLRTPAYLAAKAAQSGQTERGLASLNYDALLQIMSSGTLRCLSFALMQGLDPNFVFGGVGAPSVGCCSLLQLAIETDNVDMVQLLLNQGAVQEQSCFLGSVRFDARQYLERNRHLLTNHAQIDSLLNG